MNKKRYSGFMKSLFCSFLLIFTSLLLVACPVLENKSETTSESTHESPKKGNVVRFIGVDISGSFKHTKYFKDSLKFLSNYMYAHLHGHLGQRKPHSLFVGSIGGARANEPKTFYPIQTFEYKSIDGIEKELFNIFPKKETNQFTDYSAFFQQIATFMRNKKLVMKPTEIILFSDGIPDTKSGGQYDYRSFGLQALENLSRKITVRVLYTSASTGMNWQTKVPRRRVRVWTQDANVMVSWKAKDIFQPEKPFAEKTRFFKWIKDNVDFPVRVRRVQ